MNGPEGWPFPHLWRMVEGDRLVAGWMNRLPGRRDDGTCYEALGISILEHAGEGKLRSEEDLLNMVHVMELVMDSGWIPGPEVTMPPQRPPR